VGRRGSDGAEELDELALRQNFQKDTALIANEKLRRNLLSGVALAILAGLLALFAIPNYRLGEPSLAGKPARDFALTLDGKAMHLSDLRGKVVVLNFWASWCPPCVEEAPAMNGLQQKIAGRGGTILGISVDDDNTAYEDFLKQYSIDFPTYRDATKKIGENYGTRMYPETYIVDREGRIDRKLIGGQDWTGAEMMAYFDTLLAKK
jgi:peroxiredoxin